MSKLFLVVIGIIVAVVPPGVSTLKNVFLPSLMFKISGWVIYLS